MRIAFLCLAHNNFQYLSLLSQYYCSDNDDLFIHVDSNVINFDKKIFHPKVHWVNDSDRKRTRWGTYEIVEATIELIKMANLNSFYDRYILISGSDIPLCDKKTLKKLISNDIEYIAIWDVVSRKNIINNNNELSCEFFKYNNNKIFNYAECKDKRLKLRLSLILKKILHSMPYAFNGTREFYAKGSQWWCITDLLALEFLSEFSNQFSSEFKHMHAPDEKFFHTIAINSYRAKNLIGVNIQMSSSVHAIHYIDWPNSSKNKLDFTYEEISTAKNSGALFARKIKYADISSFEKYIFSLIDIQ